LQPLACWLYEFNKNHIEINTNSVEFNTKHIEINANPVEFITKHIEINANPVEFNTIYINTDIDYIEFNINSIETAKLSLAKTLRRKERGRHFNTDGHRFSQIICVYELCVSAP
jgi:hypothetical protein